MRQNSTSCCGSFAMRDFVANHCINMFCFMSEKSRWFVQLLSCPRSGMTDCVYFRVFFPKNVAVYFRCNIMFFILCSAKASDADSFLRLHRVRFWKRNRKTRSGTYEARPSRTTRAAGGTLTELSAIFRTNRPLTTVLKSKILTESHFDDLCKKQPFVVACKFIFSTRHVSLQGHGNHSQTS